MSATQKRVLALLDDLADEHGCVPSMSIRSLMEQTGMEGPSLRSRLFELVQTGCLERRERRAPEGETGSFRITGKEPTTARSEPVAAPTFDDATIARRLRDRYGIEVVTYQRNRYSEAISMPRVRFVEGSPA